MTSFPCRSRLAQLGWQGHPVTWHPCRWQRPVPWVQVGPRRTPETTRKRRYMHGRAGEPSILRRTGKRLGPLGRMLDEAEVPRQSERDLADVLLLDDGWKESGSGTRLGERRRLQDHLRKATAKSRVHARNWAQQAQGRRPDTRDSTREMLELRPRPERRPGRDPTASLAGPGR